MAVTLTPAGHALVERLVYEVLGRAAALLAGLSSDERAELTRLLRILLRDLQGRLGYPNHTQVGAS